MPRTSRVVLQRRTLELLSLVQRKSENPSHVACLSIRDMQVELGLSDNCVRLAMYRAINDGLVAKRERYLPNGGQLENAYALTPKGRAYLRFHLEARRGESAVMKSGERLAETTRKMG